MLRAVAGQKSRNDNSQSRSTPSETLRPLLEDALVQNEHIVGEVEELLERCSCIAEETLSADCIDLNDTFPDDALPRYTAQIALLQEVLQNYKCACEAPDTRSQKLHQMRLRLMPTVLLSEENSVEFQMLFSSSPDPPLSKDSGWQDIQIAVPRYDRTEMKNRTN